MIQTLNLSESVQQVFRATSRGVVGLVDDLLGLCNVHQLRFRFEQGNCLVRRLGDDESDTISVPLPKSVFRAALARIAALCNEQKLGSVTPYGGQGEIIVSPSHTPKGSLPSTCYVSFLNTSSEQQLDIRFAQSTASERNRFTVLLRDQRTVTVSGDSLRFIPNASNQSDYGSCGISSHIGGSEVLVALFRVSEVVGVFNSDQGGLFNTSPVAQVSPTAAVLPGREASRQEALNAPSWPS